MPTPYRYILQPYAGPASRYPCPACERRRELVRYLDTETGELVPEAFGKCNRADNCGYHLSPYHVGASGVSWAEQQYLDRRALAGPTPWAAPRPVARPQPAAPAPRPVVSIPPDVVAATLGS